MQSRLTQHAPVGTGGGPPHWACSHVVSGPENTPPSNPHIASVVNAHSSRTQHAPGPGGAEHFTVAHEVPGPENVPPVNEQMAAVTVVHSPCTQQAPVVGPTEQSV